MRSAPLPLFDTKLTMTAKNILVPVLFSLFLCLSCGGDTPSGSSPAPQLTLARNDVPSAKGNQFVRVTTPDAWTLQTDASWVNLTPSSGSGSKTDVVLSYAANPGEASRTARITLNAGSQSATAVLTQAGGPVGGDDPGNQGGDGDDPDQPGGGDGPDNPGGDEGDDPPVMPQADVETGKAEDIDTYGATLNGSFSWANGSIRETGFEWGATASLGETLQCSQTFTGEHGSFSARLTGLGDGKTYYFRAYTAVQIDDRIRFFYGETESFTTVAEDKPQTQAGWAELPVMNIKKSGNYLVDSSDPDIYYAYHITPDVTRNGKKVRNYTVCFSAEHHSPLWVAAPLHTSYTGSSGRSEAYKPDPDIPSDIQYQSSKASAGLANYTRGHMLGSSDRTVTRATNEQVYYYSNIAPQQQTNFNTGGGRWNSLEEWVGKQECSDTLYAVIGAYYDEFTDGYGKSGEKKKLAYAGRTDVSNPTMFYYVLLRTKSGNSGKPVTDCSASELKCVAMVRAHVGERQAVTRQEMMSVADLEKITGFTFFANVPNAPKTTYNASDWGL